MVHLWLEEIISILWQTLYFGKFMDMQTPYLPDMLAIILIIKIKDVHKWLILYSLPPILTISYYFTYRYVEIDDSLIITLTC